MINDFKQYIMFYYKDMFTTNKPLKIRQIIKDFFLQKQANIITRKVQVISILFPASWHKSKEEGFLRELLPFNNALVSK